MQDKLEEFIPFLKNDARIELKSVAVQHILSESRSTNRNQDFVQFHEKSLNQQV